MNKNIDIEATLDNLEKSGLFDSRETIHSKALAYFLRKNPDFLKRILNNADIYNYEKADMPVVNHEVDGRKDIEIKNNKFVLVIENKYKDRNRNEQLEKYENDIEEKYPKLERKFIYLRPFMHKLSDNCRNWKQYTYKEIKNFLQETLPINGPEKSYAQRYIKIIENQVYGMQKFCMDCLTKILKYENKTNFAEDDRDDIDGWSIQVPVKELLDEKYNSFLQIEYFSPFEKFKGKLKINLAVEKIKKTKYDDILLKKVRDALGYKRLQGDKTYTWCCEGICQNKDDNFSEEVIREKLKNSRIISILKQENIF